MSKDEIEKSWLRLLKDVKEIEDRFENVVIIGDMNRAVGSGPWGVKGNKDKISPGGQLIRNLIQTERYVLINNLYLVEGGPWTWVDRQDNTRQSCLDLGIISVSLLPFISKVVIDSNRNFTPRRVIKSKKKIKTIYTDHFSVLIELSEMPRKQHPTKVKPTWNKGKPGAWDIFERVTDEYAERIEEIVDDSENNIETVMKEIENIDTKIKFISFGKTKAKSKKSVPKRKEDKTQHEKDVELKQKENERVEKEIELIKVKNQGRGEIGRYLYRISRVDI